MTFEEFEKNEEYINELNYLKERRGRYADDNSIYLNFLTEQQKKEIKDLYLKYNKEQLEKCKTKVKNIDKSEREEILHLLRQIRNYKSEVDNLYCFRKEYDKDLKEVCDNWVNQREFEIMCKIKRKLEQIK